MSTSSARVLVPIGLALWLAGCSGGGGSGGPSASIGFSSSALSVDEDSAVAELTVVLHAPVVELQSAASVLVPFFLYLPANLIHVPLQVSDEMAAPYLAMNLGSQTSEGLRHAPESARQLWPVARYVEGTLP